MQTRQELGRAGTDEGFTLIELLVVIIIIGILAAIAIPVFLKQREQSYDSAMKSDIHTLAQFEEAYMVDDASYGSFADLGGASYDMLASRDVTLTLTFDGAYGYCIEATHPGSSTTWYYDSQGGGLQAKGTPSCPVTTGGTSGGSVTG